MNKKVGTFTKKDYDDSEDLEIREVAYSKGSYFGYILGLFFIMLLGIICITYTSYGNFITTKDKKDNIEVIEITNTKGNVLITNNGSISENVTNDSFIINKDSYSIYNIDSIELKENKNDNEKVKIKYDVKYEIINNTFKHNSFENENSDVLVRFSYSYDKEEWIDSKNVVSITESTITPLMGNTFDIAGLNDTLRVATDVELEAEQNKPSIIYWRSETIFNNNHITNFDCSLKANFKIEYKGIE